MKHSEIIELIREVSNSTLTSFCYEEGDVCLSFKKKEKDVVVVSQQETKASEQVEVAESKQEKAVETVKEGTYVNSPLVGTFYVAPKEGEEPYVQVGDSVKKGQVIAIVEAMKLMNEIEAECDGVGEEILAENGQMVEFGQPLFRFKR